MGLPLSTITKHIWSIIDSNSKRLLAAYLILQRKCGVALVILPGADYDLQYYGKPGTVAEKISRTL